MTTLSPEIAELARSFGIELAYWDAAGVFRTPPDASIEKLVAALTANPYAANREVAAELTADIAVETAARALPSIVVLQHGQAGEIALRRPIGTGTLGWTLTAEDGTAKTGTTDFAALPLIDESAGLERRALALPGNLPLGYHSFALAGDARPACIAVTPERGYLPPQLEHARVWGIAVQLYGLRSASNWGIGDFTDLARLVEWAADNGCAAIGLNPLHALFLGEPELSCPYWPNSREWLNPLYIDPAAVPGYATAPDVRELVASPDFAARLEAARATPLVDYRAVTDLKLPVLVRLFDALDAAGDLAELDAWVESRGNDLRRFAAYSVIRENIRNETPHLTNWRFWPTHLHEALAPETLDYIGKRGKAARFHEWLQYEAHRQLSACHAAAGRLAIGLYHDLAVGCGDGAAESWGAADTSIPGWSIGAPPDPLGPKGQDWGSVPPRPDAWRERAYAPFLALIRANMAYAGALRIDHILGLMRLFLVPHGGLPADGTYIRMPLDELVALLKLESHRQRCLVIGEDLGTVPEGLSERLQAGGILSYRLLYFARRDGGWFVAPQDYPAEALVSIGTHDLPPFAGYWQGTDIDVKLAAGLFTEEDASKERYFRGEFRQRLVQALHDAGLKADEAGAVPTLAATRYLARSPGRLLMLSLEDVLEVTDQVNIPGSTHEHPNWQHKLPADLETVLADPRLAACLAVLHEERPGTMKFSS